MANFCHFFWPNSNKMRFSKSINIALFNVIHLIIIAGKNVMDKIDYFSDIHEVLETMTDVKEYSMYTDKIRDSFGYDNETIMSYKVCKNNVPIYAMPKWWHHKNHYWSFSSFDPDHKDYALAKHEYESTTKSANSVIVHFISKNFGLVL